MKTKIKFTCPGCLSQGEMDMPIEAAKNQYVEIHFGEGIHTDQVCPNCGHPISWPGGDYVRDKNGYLERVGDYTETPRSV